MIKYGKSIPGIIARAHEEKWQGHTRNNGKGVPGIMARVYQE